MRTTFCSSSIQCLLLGIFLVGGGGRNAFAQTPTFVPPPRTISDITAILDQEKPDPAKIAKSRAEADKAPPPGGSRTAMAQFSYLRAQARSELSRYS